MAARNRFLASASHDLRQPLHAMGLVLGALSRAGLNERQQTLLGQAQSAAMATGDMLATLLDFSKVDAGVIQPRPQPFNLQHLFRRLERELAPVAEAKKTTVASPDELILAPGFKADLVYTVPRDLQGSWVSLAVAPNGDLVAGDQGGPAEK